MARPAVYTDQSLAFIYKELVHAVGRCALGCWKSQTPKKDFLTSARYNVIIAEIFVKYAHQVDIGTPGFPAMPKTSVAIRQQIAWCMTRQDMDRLDEYQIRVMQRNRQAAYRAGFLTMNDIIKLEQHQGV